MAEIVLFHVLAATAGAAFGLLAVWAGLGRPHWILRFIPVAAVIVALFPVPAFDLALVFVSQGLVVGVPLLLVRRFKAPPADGTASANPPPSPTWRRFSVADLFRATLLMATVFGVLAYSPGDVRESWWRYVLLGSGFGVAALAGTWAALTGGSMRVRCIVLCVVASLAGVPEPLEKTIYVNFQESPWVGYAVTAVTAAIGLQVASWLILWQATGLMNTARLESGASTTSPSPRGFEAFRQLLGCTGLVVLSLAILLLPTIAYYQMRHPAPIPVEPLPEPNAYVDLLRIAEAVQSAGTAEHRQLFNELRSTLQRPSAVPIQYESKEWNLDDGQRLKQLAEALSSEAKQQWLTGKKDEAQRTYREILRLGLVASRGGDCIDLAFGSVIAGKSVDAVYELRTALSRDERREWIAALQEADVDWEPFANVDARVLAARHCAFGWPARVTLISKPPTSSELFENQRLVEFRILICELALTQFVADHGQSPKRLAELVPLYLTKIPDDPYSGRPLVYRTEPAGYVLYSVGQNGVDDGGRRGAPWEHSDLFLDPIPAPAGDCSGED